MNLDWYYTYLVFAKHLNYRKAADELFITQPSVFNQIKKLEQHLQLKLFQTSGRSTHLTEEGRLFWGIAQKLISTYEESMFVSQSLKSKYSSHLDIVVTSYIATYLIPKFLPIFFKTAPDISISVSVTNNDIAQLVEEHKFDIGIDRIGPFSKCINSEKVCEGTIKLVVPNNSSYNLKNEIDYFKHYRIFGNNHPTYWNKLAKEIHALVPEAEITSIKDVKVTENLIINNEGISYLPIYILKENSNSKLKVIEPQFIESPISFTYLMWSVTSPEISTFNELFRQFIKYEHV